ncbi:MAG: endonuclease III [Phycisphaerae bacterium]
MKKKTVRSAPARKRTGTRRESAAARAARGRKILAALRKQYPAADCALRHRSAFQLLVSTILSAQCTDDRVNQVTPELFKRYRTPRDFAAADPGELEAVIRSTGFFRNKTRNIMGAARVLAERFGGRVPDTMENLLQLPGVARKTANVILSTWFQKNEGFVVDTHVGRLAERLGLTWRARDSKDAVKIEQDLMAVFPQTAWGFLGHALIWHGRQVCSARKPDCARCSLAALCPSACSLDGAAKPRGERPAKARRASGEPRQSRS